MAVANYGVPHDKPVPLPGPLSAGYVGVEARPHQPGRDGEEVSAQGGPTGHRVSDIDQGVKPG